MMYKYAISNLHNVPLETAGFFAFARFRAHRGPGGPYIYITNERTAQAMRKTNLYGLNLWDLEDRIKMEDFNSDNEKLEAALSSLARGAKNFGILTSSGSETMSGQYFWPNSDTRWGDYSLMLIVGNLRPVSSGDSVFVRLSAPGQTTPETEFVFPSGGFFLLLTPMRWADIGVQGLFGCSGTMKGFQGTTPFQDFTTLYFGGRTAAGGSAKFYGDYVHIIGIR